MNICSKVLYSTLSISWLISVWTQCQFSLQTPTSQSSSVPILATIHKFMELNCLLGITNRINSSSISLSNSSSNRNSNQFNSSSRLFNLSNSSLSNSKLLAKTLEKSRNLTILRLRLTRTTLKDLTVQSSLKVHQTRQPLPIWLRISSLSNRRLLNKLRLRLHHRPNNLSSQFLSLQCLSRLLSQSRPPLQRTTSLSTMLPI